MVEDGGIAISVLPPTLPTAGDLQGLERRIREELALADPREGGGELSMTTMISECVVDVVEQFCGLARGATSGGAGGAGTGVEEKREDGFWKENGLPTEQLLHDMKVAGILVSFGLFGLFVVCSLFLCGLLVVHGLIHAVTC